MKETGQKETEMSRQGDQQKHGISEEDSFHSIYHKLRTAHRRRFFGMLSQVGLSEGQPKIIGYLSRHDGCIQRELAENCHIKASTVTSVLTVMEKNGLISRAACLLDRRIQNVYLTQKGWEAVAAIEKVNDEVDEIAFCGFTMEERNATIDLLKRLYSNLKEDDSDTK